MKLTPARINQITNIIAAIRAGILLGLMSNQINMFQTIAAYIITGVVSNFFDGKGIPTIAQVTSEIQANMGQGGAIRRG